MREILFRGKRIDNGEWAIGDIRFIGTRIEIGGGYVSNEVDPKTVGQFTGLLDKNGKKIFEGDIVNHGYENDYGEFYDHYKVIYSNTNTCFVLEAIYPCNPIKRLTKNNVISRHTEVIGNIYDNPELLHES